MYETKKRQIDEIIRASDEWEPVGPTPMPDISTLRGWTMRLLETYKPFYLPSCDFCCRCTFGKCDLTGDKKGACGIDISAQQAREFLISCCQGMAAHTAHASHLLEYLIDKHGEDHKIDLGPEVLIEAPIIRTVVGLKPENLGDLRKVLAYVEGQLCHLLSSTHTGQEGSHIDYEAKSLHAGLMDMVGMEVCDIAQISALNMPKSSEDTSLVDIGWRSADINKPVILCIGHAVAPSKEVLDYLMSNNLNDDIEVCGICCTAIDNTRLSDKAKVIGPLSKQLSYIRTGIADVIITDEQCIRCDVPLEAKKAGSALIATSDKVSYGLENVTDKDPDEIVDMLVNQRKQVLILDPVKVGEVAPKAAIRLESKRIKTLMKESEVIDLAKACKQCSSCDKVCPNFLSIGEAVHAASTGNLELLRTLYLTCVGCGECDQECPVEIPIVKLMQTVASPETFKMRTGRGAAHELDVRRIGKALGIGTGAEGKVEIGSGAGMIPGIIAFVGCSNLPDAQDIVEMAEEFAKRKYLILLTGCVAMVASMRRDQAGNNIYEKYPPVYGPGGVLNVGSCVSNSHIAGLALKVAQVYAKIPLRANFEAIADYILHRIPAVGVAWGAYSQKATSIATGANILGIPVVLGPQGSKYRRLLLSDGEEGQYQLKDIRTDEIINVGQPYPEHLITAVESKERVMVTVAKMCLRNSDQGPFRAPRLFHYIDLHKKYMGTLPNDIHLHVRNLSDIPLVYKKEVMEILEEKGWTSKEAIPTPTWIGTYPR
jgi:acetyl-CoA decarbonylase/synthase complex subunit alpha